METHNNSSCKDSLDNLDSEANAKHGLYAARGNLLLRRTLNVRLREQLGPEDMTSGKWVELANRWWKLPLPGLRETYKTANTARLSLLFALQLEDDPRTRASAIVAAALERAILLELRRDPQLCGDLALDGEAHLVDVALGAAGTR